MNYEKMLFTFNEALKFDYEFAKEHIEKVNDIIEKMVLLINKETLNSLLEYFQLGYIPETNIHIPSIITRNSHGIERRLALLIKNDIFGAETNFDFIYNNEKQDFSVFYFVKGRLEIKIAEIDIYNRKVFIKFNHHEKEMALINKLKNINDEIKNSENKLEKLNKSLVKENKKIFKSKTKLNSLDHEIKHLKSSIDLNKTLTSVNEPMLNIYDEIRNNIEIIKKFIEYGFTIDWGNRENT